MSDLDYDEIDQAVSGAMDTESPPPPPPEEPNPDPTPVPRPPVKPRGRYLDMINTKSDMRPPKSVPTPTPKPTPAPVPTKIEHTTEFGVIEDNTEEEQRAEADFVAQPTPFAAPVEPEAPNPDNYALGGQSPFLEDAIVEKRPLGDYVSSDNNRAVKSTKNVYSQRSAISDQPLQKSPFAPEIIAEPPKKAGLGRFFLVLFIIALGALAGVVAWLILSPYST